MRRERGNGGGRRPQRGSGGPSRGRSQRGGRGDRHSRRHPRQSAESGNQRERIAIESGDLVLIDQFMLANPQFIEKMATVVDEDTTVKNEVIREYGGKVIAVTRGTYRIERDPFAYTIVVHPEGDSLEAPDMVKDATETLGEVNIDTRCLAMLDRELLDDNSLLERYQQLWFDGQDKACRDLLRDNGGAVRYGFRRDGDELVVFQVPGADIICLWPKNIEELTLNQDTQAAQEG
ncbi:MAG: hypothetical protein NTV65_07920 [Proteobacteria bacterium]|jgi:hypothetical protein|nr:hypothetical protein [Pseudomonadota bacterium]